MIFYCSMEIVTYNCVLELSVEATPKKGDFAKFSHLISSQKADCYRINEYFLQTPFSNLCICGIMDACPNLKRKGIRMKKSRLWFLIIHAAMAVLLCLFPLYRYVMEWLPPVLSGCFLHDKLFLYCATCGGTRVVEALLHFDILRALELNCFVVISFAVTLILDVIAWIRFFQKKNPFFSIPKGVWIPWLTLTLVYPIARNVLMIAFGFDPTGDLVGFWDAVMGR